MNSMFYVFQDPFGLNDCKVGKTSHPAIRLGTYQNSYSSRSHRARFDYAWVGPSIDIDQLERAVKDRYDWEIERDGRGHSEWVLGKSAMEIRSLVNDLIAGYCFRVNEVPDALLPITVNSADGLLE